MQNNNKSFSSKVLQSFLYSGLGNTAGKLINVAALFVVLKFISPAELGIASIVLAIFSIVYSLSEMGLGVALVQAQKLDRQQVDTFFWLSLCVTVPVYLFIYIAAPLASAFYKQPELTNLIRFYGLVVIIFSLYMVSRNMLKRELEFKQITIAENSSLICSAFIMVWFAYRGWGAWSIIIGEFTNRAGQLVMLQFYYPYFPKLQFNYQKIKKHVQFGLYATGSRLLGNLYSNADYLIVGKFFGAEAVGIYTLAFRIVRDTVQTLITNINEVAYPALAKLQGNIIRLKKYFYIIVKGSLLLISFVLIILSTYIRELLVLFGYNKWLEAVPLIYIFTGYAIFRSVEAVIPQLINANGKSQLNFKFSILISLIMPAGFIIASQFSLLAVAWVWVTVYPLAIILLLYYGSSILNDPLWKFTYNSFRGAILIPIFLVITTAVNMVSTYYFNEQPIVFLLVGISLSAAIILALIYYRERETIHLFMRKKPEKIS